MAHVRKYSKKDGTKVKSHERNRFHNNNSTKRKNNNQYISPFNDGEFQHLGEHLGLSIKRIRTASLNNNQDIFDYDLSGSKYDRIRIVYNKGDTKLSDGAVNVWKGSSKTRLDFKHYGDLVHQLLK